MMTTSDGIYDEACITERINTMRMREENTPRCHIYFTQEVDSRCRKLMVDWCFAVVDAFALSRETVGVAMSILDRYLSSGKGKSCYALTCTQAFQRTAITSLFMAIKIHEPAVLGLKLLVKLCRGVYRERDIIATENEILFALDWRVYASSTSPMEYVRHFVQLLPECADAADVILENAARRMDVATSDVYFSTHWASSVGVACLAGALDDMYMISPLDSEALWKKLSNFLDFDIASNEIRQVEKRLNAESSSCVSPMPSRASLPRSSLNSGCEQPSSPGSVAQ
ncbi:hypothetical protein ACHAXA_009013 [Cyclostephanos tholiformis]|jgi:hypothetical protein|uniref:Cyclin-like domain-containing protein n=1 Tax=Cyclostephanos tholiformis TaxID=382380 RepID=A0ABD3RTC6_9STRA